MFNYQLSVLDCIFPDSLLIFDQKEDMEREEMERGSHFSQDQSLLIRKQSHTQNFGFYPFCQSRLYQDWSVERKDKIKANKKISVFSQFFTPFLVSGMERFSQCQCLLWISISFATIKRKFLRKNNYELSLSSVLHWILCPASFNVPALSKFLQFQNPAQG